MDEKLGPDIPKLRKLIDHIAELPAIRVADSGAAAIGAHDAEFWDQNQWMVPWNAVLGKTPGEVTLTAEGLIDTFGVKCGTACCLAGEDALMFAPLGTRFGRDCMKLPDSLDWVSIELWAEADLRLTPVQAEELFSGSNTLDCIRRIADEIEDGTL